MDYTNELRAAFAASNLKSFLSENETKSGVYPVYGNPEFELFKLSVNTNTARIRSMEYYPEFRDGILRIYHSHIVSKTLKSAIADYSGMTLCRSNSETIDFKMPVFDGAAVTDYMNYVLECIEDPTVAEDIVATSPTSRSKGFEGLNLPDIDTDTDAIYDMTFTWKDILAISENPGSDLHKALSQPGVYLQSSKDGVSRYVGSAYSDGGILSRWVNHINYNGDAKFLKFYILENGYNNIEFSILEITSKTAAVSKETSWKKRLHTKSPVYNAIQLNNN